MTLFAILFYLPASNAASITVRSDRNPVSLNESFHLIYQSDGSVDDDPDFTVLEKFLDILSRSQSSNMSIINGKYSSTKTWTLTVMAKQQGKITLPPVSFGRDQSLSYQLKVKPASKDAAAKSLFYSRLEVDQQQVYAQQQVVVSQKVFSARNLSAFGMGELDFNGSDVVVHQLGDEKQYQTQLGGRQYLVIERRYALFPQSDGLLQISPVLAEGRVASARNSFFDTFGGSDVVRARSNALSIAVLPVPQNSGVDPWLPAKSLQLEEQWPQKTPKFIVGEPLTRTLSIKAEGLTAAQLPQLPAIEDDGWKQYPDQPLLNDIDNDDGVTGYRVEKVALIPTRAGRLTLPAIEIKWWNTLTQQTEVAGIPPRVVDVSPAAQSSPPATPAPSAAPPPVAATAPAVTVDPPIQPKPVTDAKRHLWVYVSILLALGWGLTLFVWWLKSRRRGEQIVATEHARPLLEQLKPLQSACRQQDLPAFRHALLQWGDAFLGHPPGLTLQQISAQLPQTLGAEIRKLDAVLYGAKGQTVDCQSILRELEQISRRQQKQHNTRKAEGLEPLYR